MGELFNLYLVMSEIIPYIVWEDWFNQVGHREDYRIADLVVAKSHAQAKYIAWREDPDGDTFPVFVDMPKFAVRLKEKGVEGPARIVSEEWNEKADKDIGAETEGYSQWTFDLWDVGKAEHIGIGGK